MNLYEKLAKIRSLSDVVKKSKKGYNYSYADVTEILANVTAGMKKYGVSLIPTIVPGTTAVEQHTVTNTKFDRAGKPYDNTTTEMLVTANMVFTWVNDSEPSERIDVPWFVTGSQSDPSQAFGAGLTYCTRYFLCNYFQIAQADTDVDTYRSKQKAAEESEDRAIAAGIIDEFDTILKTYLSDHREQADDVKQFISRFVKDSNYRQIKEPALASKLIGDFREKYIKE